MRRTAKDALKYAGVILLLLISLGTIVSVGYYGYVLLMSPIQQKQFADSFTVEGECIITSKTSIKKCGCSGQEVTDCCWDSWKYEYKIYNNSLCSHFIDVQNQIFDEANTNKEDVDEASYYDINETVSCYTNQDCDDVFIDGYYIEYGDSFHPLAVVLFFVSALGCCVYCYCCYMAYIHFDGENFKELIEYKLDNKQTEEGEMRYYEREWVDNLEIQHKVDYFLSFYYKIYGLSLVDKHIEILIYRYTQTT